MNRNDLKVYKYNQKWIEGRLEYIKEYKERILSISISLSGIKIEKKIQDSMAENLAILLDNTNELLDRINAEAQKQKEILNQLENVKQPYRVILEKVYIQGKTLVTVASELNYSYEDICRKNGKALDLFDSLETNQ